jgi:glycosyltransferase involved in cell wall biosynthesis
VGRADSDPGRWLEESGGGWRVDQGDVDGLLRALEAAADLAERARRGAAARAYAAEHFDRERNCARLAALLEEAAAAGPPERRIAP